MGSDFDSDRTRVFISHAAQPDPFADGFRRRLANRLAIDYDVLLDEDAIDPGDEWRSKLYRWLGTCEAAISLVNEAVIAKPDWVRFETHVVSWRREFSDDVVVIPVLLPGVTADDLQQIGLGTCRGRCGRGIGGIAAGPAPNLADRAHRLSVRPTTRRAIGDSGS